MIGFIARADTGARRKAVTQQTTVGKCTMTKAGKSDDEGTFTGTRGNDKVAP
jgi:hypothetical protein